MLRKSIQFFIAGILTTILGEIFLGLLFSADDNSFILKLVSLFSTLFSLALYYLSKIEKRKPLRVFCVVVSIIYTITLFGDFLPTSIPLIKFSFVWGRYILETVMLLLAANVLLGKTKKPE